MSFLIELINFEPTCQSHIKYIYEIKLLTLNELPLKMRRQRMFYFGRHSFVGYIQCLMNTYIHFWVYKMFFLSFLN